MERIFDEFVSFIHSEEQLQEILSYLPESASGLFPIAQGLFHKSPQVQRHAVILIRRMEAYKSTRNAVNNIDWIIQTAYQRKSKIVPAGAENDALFNPAGFASRYASVV